MNRAPFKYFGGKATIAAEVWRRFGKITQYVEPFCGSAAVLLNAPYIPEMITLNDKDCYISNFWRAIQHDPEKVIETMNTSVIELDLHAWSFYLGKKRDEIQEIMETDPRWYDAEIAGRWAWGMAFSIGDVFITGCKGKPIADKMLWTKSRESLHKRIDILIDYIRPAKVLCGDWKRVLTNSYLNKDDWVNGIFLDPPYCGKDIMKTYSHNNDIESEVYDWCISHGDNPRYKIALCGYNLTPIEGWNSFSWSAHGGYSNVNSKNRSGKKDCETILFSPHCLKQNLFCDSLNTVCDSGVQERGVNRKNDGGSESVRGAFAMTNSPHHFLRRRNCNTHHSREDIFGLTKGLMIAGNQTMR